MSGWHTADDSHEHGLSTTGQVHMYGLLVPRPGHHKPILLQRWFGLPNPECRQVDMQTEACSNDITIPEKFLPSREDLVKTAPMFFPKEYLTTPLLPPAKK